ncbi:hypothetical protein LTR85_007437 [Meristemomyces frigidus]|nr:hypothetical protein LTR85_007437 [Meristemomyces frigidus]
MGGRKPRQTQKLKACSHQRGAAKVRRRTAREQQNGQNPAETRNDTLHRVAGDTSKHPRISKRTRGTTIKARLSSPEPMDWEPSMYTATRPGSYIVSTYYFDLSDLEGADEDDGEPVNNRLARDSGSSGGMSSNWANSSNGEISSNRENSGNWEEKAGPTPDAISEFTPNVSPNGFPDSAFDLPFDIGARPPLPDGRIGETSGFGDAPEQPDTHKSEVKSDMPKVDMPPSQRVSSGDDGSQAIPYLKRLLPRSCRSNTGLPGNDKNSLEQTQQLGKKLFEVLKLEDQLAIRSRRPGLLNQWLKRPSFGGSSRLWMWDALGLDSKSPPQADAMEPLHGFQGLPDDEFNDDDGEVEKVENGSGRRDDTKDCWGNSAEPEIDGAHGGDEKKADDGAADGDPANGAKPDRDDLDGGKAAADNGGGSRGSEPDFGGESAADASQTAEGREEDEDEDWEDSLGKDDFGLE